MDLKLSVQPCDEFVTLFRSFCALFGVGFDQLISSPTVLSAREQLFLSELYTTRTG